MTIEEAIEHCDERSDTCSECGREHAQLAEWLRELVLYRRACNGLIPEEIEELKNKIRTACELESTVRRELEYER
jgi:DNA repair exonuclease SbcCD ATPase subunit